MHFELPFHGISPFSHNSIKITHFCVFSWNWGKFHQDSWFRDLLGDLLGNLHNTCKFYWLFRAPREENRNLHENSTILVISMKNTPNGWFLEENAFFGCRGSQKWLKNDRFFVCFVTGALRDGKKLIFHENHRFWPNFKKIHPFSWKSLIFQFSGQPSANPTYSLSIPMVFRGPRGLQTRKTIKIVILHENTIKVVIFMKLTEKSVFLPILKKFLISGPPGEPKYLWDLQVICMFLSRCPQGHPKTTNFMKIHQFSLVFMKFH